MKYHGVSIYDGNDNKYRFTIPMVYTNNNWELCEGYIRLSNTWKRIGDAGTQMLWFKDHNNQYVYANGLPFLVREELDGGIDNSIGAGLTDIYENQLLDSNDNILIG